MSFVNMKKNRKKYTVFSCNFYDIFFSSRDLPNRIILAQPKRTQTELDPNEWVNDTTDLLKNLFPDAFDASRVESTSDEDECVELIFEFLSSHMSPTMNIVSVPTDVFECSLLQMLTFAQIFSFESGLPKLSKHEEKKWARVLGDIRGANVNQSAREDMSTDAWVRSCQANVNLRELKRDFSDGVVLLKLIDAVQENSVDWDRVRSDVRHKFDRMNNCNLAVNICKQNLGLDIVGVHGSDLVNGNEKCFESILWQMMKFQVTRLVSTTEFNDRQVSEEDLLRWANRILIKLGKKKKSFVKHENGIESLVDNELSTCVFYLDLLSFIREECVDWNMIDNIPPLRNVKSKRTRRAEYDEFASERLANANYVTTVVRKLGLDLFVSPRDLVACDYQAVFGVLCSIMTLDVIVANDDSYLAVTPPRVRSSSAVLSADKRLSSMNRMDSLSLSRSRQPRKSNAHLFGRSASPQAFRTESGKEANLVRNSLLP